MTWFLNVTHLWKTSQLDNFINAKFEQTESEDLYNLVKLAPPVSFLYGFIITSQVGTKYVFHPKVTCLILICL